MMGGYYHLAYVPAEDYELWTRIVMKYPIHILEDKARAIQMGRNGKQN